MPRLPRFESHRFVGTRDTMVAYDTDDPVHVRELAGRIEAEALFARALLHTFGPDTVSEVVSRGFRLFEGDS